MCVCVCVCVFGATVGVPFLLIEWLAGTCQFKWVVCVCVFACVYGCVYAHKVTVLSACRVLSSFLYDK